jgi:hypothetical protein
VFKIGIAKHDQESSVKENTNEDRVCDVPHLIRFSLASNSIDNFDNNHSYNHVDDNNQVFQKVIHR